MGSGREGPCVCRPQNVARILPGVFWHLLVKARGGEGGREHKHTHRHTQTQYIYIYITMNSVPHASKYSFSPMDFYTGVGLKRSKELV